MAVLIPDILETERQRDIETLDAVAAFNRWIRDRFSAPEPPSEEYRESMPIKSTYQRWRSILRGEAVIKPKEGGIREALYPENKIRARRR